MNIFEVAVRQKWRFGSNRGQLSVEQLWDVPLRSKDGFDLNAVAVAASLIVREAADESFVEAVRTAEQGRAETVLEIVKHVIAVKLAEEEAAQDRITRRAEKNRLLEALAQKQSARLGELSEKEIQKRLAALGD